MQFSTLKSALLVGALAVVGATAQSTYRIISQPAKPINSYFYQISWVNSSPYNLLAGDAKFLQAAEPFVVIFSGGDGSLRFLSYHTERYQTFYVLKDKASPAQVNLWQGIPSDAIQSGFTIDGDGYLGLAGDNDIWALCPTAENPKSYQLYYVADGTSAPSGCIDTKLKTEVYGSCS